MVTRPARGAPGGVLRVLGLAGAGVLASLAMTSTAYAAPAKAGPVLRTAVIDVTPDPSRRVASVKESITVTGVKAGAAVKHLLAAFAGLKVDELSVSVGATSVPTKTIGGDHADTVTFTAPTAGTLSYDIAYTVAQSGSDHVPILVPQYPTDGSRAVRLVYHVPDGYHIQGEPFPVNIDSTGTQQRDLIGVPSFLAYQLATVPSSSWSVFSWLGVLIIVVGVAMSAVVIIKQVRADRR